MSHQDPTDADDTTLERSSSGAERGTPSIEAGSTAPRTDRPAVGLIATSENGEVLARAILRARQHGHDVFVAHADTPDAESVAFARQLGATILEPALPDPDIEALQRELASTARTKGYPRIIVQQPSCRRIDYATTLEDAGEEVFAVDAVPETVVADPTIVVGVPAYNEAKTIDEVVAAAQGYADMVIVADDGSSDATVDVAREAGATVVEHDRNRGYGAALQTLFTEADEVGADHLVVMDADGQHEPDDIPLLVDVQREHEAEVVIGSRFEDDAEADVPLYRRIGIGVVNVLTNVSLGSFNPRNHISDTQSGFRAYDAAAISTLANDSTIGEEMDASTDILYHANDRGYSIEEVGTSVYYDIEDTSEHNPVRHGITLVHNILTTIERRHPVLLLGVPGLLSILAGVGFGFWALDRYLAWGGLPLGLSLTAVFFVLAGIFSCFTAIILHALQQPNGQ